MTYNENLFNAIINKKHIYQIKIQKNILYLFI